ncbi:hypothetical protein [Arthrobacter sp. HLT1-21]
MPSSTPASTSAETVAFTTRECMFCGHTSEYELATDQVAAIEAETLIQHVLPDLDIPIPTREMLISGTHPDCWDKAFG